MPKVTMLFHQPAKGEGFPQYADFLAKIGRAGNTIRQMVAETMSTSEVALQPSDVDFIPFPYPQGTIADLPVSIEIETIGFPERKEQLAGHNVMIQLKTNVFGALNHAGLIGELFWNISMEDPLIWLKYTDPDGPHL